MIKTMFFPKKSMVFILGISASFIDDKIRKNFRELSVILLT